MQLAGGCVLQLLPAWAHSARRSAHVAMDGQWTVKARMEFANCVTSFNLRHSRSTNFDYVQ